MKITSRKEVERGQKGKGKRQEKMRKKENARYERLGVKEKKKKHQEASWKKENRKILGRKQLNGRETNYFSFQRTVWKERECVFHSSSPTPNSQLATFCHCPFKLISNK